MRPLVPVFLSFLSGILLSGILGVPPFFYIPAIAVSLAALLFLYLRGSLFSRFSIVPLFFFIGCLFINPYTDPELPRNHILYQMDGTAQELERLGKAVEGEVTSVESTGKRTRLHLEAGSVLSGDEWIDTEGGILLTVNGRTELKPGDMVRVLAVLREPWNFGNPGEYDYKRWLNLRGVFVTGYVKDPRLISKIEDGGEGIGAAVHRVRDRISAFIDSSGATNKAPLKALIISGQGGISPEIKEAFAVTGTAHILSISGLHVGMVAAFSLGVILFILKLSERVLLSVNASKAAFAFSAFPVIIYGMLAGFPVPTQRAVIMVLAFIFAFFIGRGRDYFNTLSLAGILILVTAPYSAWDISFQLTFAAMASIIYFSPLLKGLILKEREGGKEDGFIKKTFKRKVLPVLIVTIAAGLGTSPILAYHFHRVSITGLAANLAVVPLSGLAVPALFASSIALPVSEGLAGLLLRFADAVFEVIVAVVKFFAAVPYSSVWVKPPELWEVFLFYALLLFAFNIRKGRLYRYGTPVIALVFVLGWASSGLFNAPDDNLRVTFISVGQGDSALVEFPGGKNMLIDGGGAYNTDFDTGEKVLAPFFRTKGIEKIDYMLLSHTQLDHMGGLRFIAENFDVGEFWWNGDGALKYLGTALKKNGVKERVVDASCGVKEINGARLEFLHPSKTGSFDKNNMSLVLRIRYGDKSFLFTGDIGEDAERALKGKDIKATVLKAPHHGSRYSSATVFLDAVGPEVVVVSAGRHNPFGFPHEETLERYRQAGAEVFRTDRDGAITLETDGRTLRRSVYQER